MIQITKEEKTGAKVSLSILLIAISGVILIAAFTSDRIQDLFFVFDYSLVMLFIGAIFWGSRAGVQIIRKNKHDDWTGIKAAFLILLSYLIPRLLQDMEFQHDDTLTVVKNFLAAIFSMLGLMMIPTITYGIIIGRRIRKQAGRVLQ